MAYRTIKKTKSGSYVYQVESCWDKKLKQPRQKSVYIGKLDEITGEVKPIRKLSWSTSPDRILDHGAVAVCRYLAEKQHILGALKNSFGPQQGELIFLLATFLVAEALPFFMFERWIAGVTHEDIGADSVSSSKRLSGLLNHIGIENGLQLNFLQELIEVNVGQASAALIDTTSISTWSKLDGWAAYGHNRDHEDLPQINLQLASLEPGAFPVALRLIEGSVSDVSTLLNMLRLLKSLGVKVPLAMTDRGFFSQKNIDAVHQTGSQILIPVQASSSLYKNAVKNSTKSLCKASNAFTVNDEMYYGASWHGEYSGRDYSFHFYLNDTRKGQEITRLYNLLEKAERRFMEEAPKTMRDACIIRNTLLSNGKWRLVEIVKDTSGNYFLKRKPKALSRFTNQLGYILFMTDNHDLSSFEVLEKYRSRDEVEKLFDNLKNALELSRLRVHSEEATSGKLFVALIALMLHSLLQQKLAPSRQELGRRITPRELLLDMRRIKCSILPDGQKIYSEASKRQSKILQLLQIPKAILSGEPHSGKGFPN